jgi:hypothetical protein
VLYVVIIVAGRAGYFWRKETSLMPLPIPAQQDLQQLLSSLTDKYAMLETIRQRMDGSLPEVQLSVRDGNMRLYTGLCTNLSTILGQYMRLRRLVLLPYLQELQDKEEDGHDCKSCGGGCSLQHTSQVNSMRQAHAEISEILDHLQPAAIKLSVASQNEHHERYQQLRSDMMQLELQLRELLFIEESALIPRILELQQNIGAHE